MTTSATPMIDQIIVEGKAAIRQYADSDGGPLTDYQRCCAASVFLTETMARRIDSMHPKDIQLKDIACRLAQWIATIYRQHQSRTS